MGMWNKKRETDWFLIEILECGHIYYIMNSISKKKHEEYGMEQQARSSTLCEIVSILYRIAVFSITSALKIIPDWLDAKRCWILKRTEWIRSNITVDIICLQKRKD